MKIKWKLITLFVLLILGAGLISSTVLAAGDYQIAWWTVDGGGGTVAGGDYTLSGTAGQPDAALSSSVWYGLSGGFWQGVPIDLYLIYLIWVWK